MTTDDKKGDRRVIKTKKAIYNAVARLLSEKDADEITVSEIAELADINRKTFYNYYGGIYQVFDEMENMLVGVFDGLLADIDINLMLDDPMIVFSRLSDIAKKDPELCRNLFSIRDNSGLSRKLVEVLCEKTKSVIMEQKVSLDEESVDIALGFISSGLITVYRSWYENGRKVPMEKLSETAGALCSGGFKKLIEGAERHE